MLARMATIPFGAWLPDQPALENSALVARNVRPGARSYLPFPSFNPTSTSLNARCQGAIAIQNAAGTPYNYVGETANLRVLQGNSWSAVTSGSGSYTTAVGDFWEFVQWGQTLIAVNGHTDQPQQISLGAAAFAGLSGSPPKAKHICVNRDFVVLGNVLDSATGVTRVRWSAINNPTSWTVDTATLADYQDLYTEHGEIRRLVGGIDYGLVFQARAITRQTFVGSPLAFRFDPIRVNLGLYAPQALCVHDNLVFFLSEDGFWQFDGSQTTPIGKGQVDAYFFSNLDPQYIERTVAVVDPTNKLALFAYPATGSQGKLTRILAYSWTYQRWTEITGLSLDYVYRALTAGITLDGLDALFSSIDLVTPPLDDRYWAGGNVALAGVADRRLGFFNGPNLPATIETGEIAPANPQLAHTTWVRPYVDGGVSLSVTVAVRNTLATSASWLTAVSPLSSGDCPVRATARYQRFRVGIAGSATWEHAIGIDITSSPAGMR
jgi:hypothetical protein